MLNSVTSATLPSTSPEITVSVSASLSTLLTMPTVSTGKASVTVVVCGSAAGDTTLGARVSAPDTEVTVLGAAVSALSTGFSAGCSVCGSTGSGVSTVSCVPEVAAVSCAPVLSSALGAASCAETPEPSSSALFSNSVSTLNRSSRSGSALSALLSTATVRVTYLL